MARPSSVAARWRSCRVERGMTPCSWPEGMSTIWLGSSSPARSRDVSTSSTRGTSIASAPRFPVPPGRSKWAGERIEAIVMTMPSAPASRQLRIASTRGTDESSMRIDTFIGGKGASKSPGRRRCLSLLRPGGGGPVPVVRRRSCDMAAAAGLRDGVHDHESKTGERVCRRQAPRPGGRGQQLTAPTRTSRVETPAACRAPGRPTLRHALA